jgi:hypothetical protein
LPREEDKIKVGKEIGMQLNQAMTDEGLETAASRKAACDRVTTEAKAAASAEEKSREKIAEKRARGLKKVEQKNKLAEKKEERKNKRAEKLAEKRQVRIAECRVPRSSQRRRTRTRGARGADCSCPSGGPGKGRRTTSSCPRSKAVGQQAMPLMVKPCCHVVMFG